MPVLPEPKGDPGEIELSLARTDGYGAGVHDSAGPCSSLDTGHPGARRQRQPAALRSTRPLLPTAQTVNSARHSNSLPTDSNTRLFIPRHQGHPSADGAAE